MSPERNDQEFALYYAYNVERLTETLNARAERLCAFLLILMGSAVLANVADTLALGLAVTTVAALQFVCRFGEAAGQARAQKLRYANLIGCRGSLSDAELSERIERVHEHDSHALASIEAIAFNKACLMRGQPEHMQPLARTERALAWLVGGHPCLPDRASNASGAVKAD